MSELFCDSCPLRPLKVTEAAKALEWLAGERDFEGEGGDDKVLITAAHAAVRCRFNQEVEFCGREARDETPEELQARNEARWQALNITHPEAPVNISSGRPPAPRVNPKSLGQVQSEGEKAAAAIFAGTRIR